MMMNLSQELNLGDLGILKTQLGQLQMIGRFGYNRDSEKFVDIMKGMRIMQKMAEYLVEKIVGLEKIVQQTRENYNESQSNDHRIDDNITNYQAFETSDTETNTIETNVENQDVEDSTDPEAMTVKKEIKETVGDDEGDDEISSKSIYHCKKCPRTFAYLKSLNDHECSKKCEKIPCQLCNKYISRSNKSRHNEIHLAATVTCEICDKSFKSKSAFESHEHKQVWKRDCNICNKVFRRPSLLRQHSVKIHKGVKQEMSFVRSCKICQLECTSSSAVRKHMELEHVDKAIYCDICNNQFFSKKGLKLHKKDHGIDS